MKPPPNPHLVLAVATVLPGMGQVLNRQPLRGLIFVFFILLLGAFTLKTAAADVSFVGKTAGGLFVWAIAMMDAYKTARVRRAVWGTWGEIGIFGASTLIGSRATMNA